MPKCLYPIILHADISLIQLDQPAFKEDAIAKIGECRRIVCGRGDDAYVAVFNENLAPSAVEVQRIRNGSSDAEIRTRGNRVRFHGCGDIAQLRHGRCKNGKC